MTLIRTLATAALLSSTALPALAQDLTIGRAAEPSSIDPQFSRTGPNQSTAQVMFGRLIEQDANLAITPGLAVSWEPIDDTTWEIKLREGVTFHDGSSMTADDVIFSLERTDEVPNSPAPFTDMVSNIASLEKVDDHTIRVKTIDPAPALMEDVGRVFIVSKETTEGVTSEDFTTGAAAIGTGPYKFVEYTPGEGLVVEAYDGYWGDKPEFDDVDIRFISNDAARVAALLSGEVDLIDAVPPADLPRLGDTEGFHVISAPGGRVIYLGLSMRGEQAPGVTDLQGNPLETNPFKDARVRQAISLMIDRALMVDRILGGSGEPAGQIAAPPLGGHASDLEPDQVDIERAKALLAEAGYPEGFGITVYSSNDRFPGDADIAQAIGQMLARGGLKVNGVVTAPYNVYSGNASDGEYGAFIFSLGASTPTAAPLLQGLLQTYDKEAGRGAFNRVRFSSPEFDAALDEALQEFDPDKRNAMMIEATHLAFEQMPVVPLYWQSVHWAARDGITIEGGLSEDTLPQAVSTAE